MSGKVAPPLVWIICNLLNFPCSALKTKNSQAQEPPPTMMRKTRTGVAGTARRGPNGQRERGPSTKRALPNTESGGHRGAGGDVPPRTRRRAAMKVSLIDLMKRSYSNMLTPLFLQDSDQYSDMSDKKRGGLRRGQRQQVNYRETSESSDNSAKKKEVRPRGRPRKERFSSDYSDGKCSPQKSLSISTRSARF